MVDEGIGSGTREKSQFDVQVKRTGWQFQKPQGPERFKLVRLAGLEPAF
jgi:hypothetical protein